MAQFWHGWSKEYLMWAFQRCNFGLKIRLCCEVETVSILDPLFSIFDFQMKHKHTCIPQRPYKSYGKWKRYSRTNIEGLLHRPSSILEEKQVERRKTGGQPKLGGQTHPWHQAHDGGQPQSYQGVKLHVDLKSAVRNYVSPFSGVFNECYMQNCYNQNFKVGAGLGDFPIIWALLRPNNVLPEMKLDA